MSFEVLEKPRRNLLVFTSILIVIQVTGATLSGINLPSVSLKFERPELLIYCIWAAWAHSYWYFWTTGRRFARDARALADRNMFKYEYVGDAIQREIGNLNPVKHYPGEIRIERGFFNRKVVFYNYVNHQGENQIASVSYLKNLPSEIKRDMAVLLSSEVFVNYNFGLLFGFAPVLLKFFAWLLA